MNIPKYKNFVTSIIKWLVTRLLPDNKLSSHLFGLLNKFFVIFKSRGTKEAIRFCKERRAFLFRLLSECSGDFSKSVLKFPNDLRFLRQFKQKDIPFIKLLLSVFYVSRSLRTKAEPSFSTITGPSTMREYPFCKKDFIQFWRSLGYSNRMKPGRSLDFNNYHKSSKAGPNGPALWTCITDLLAIDSSLLENISILGGQKLTEYITLLLRNIDPIASYFQSLRGGITRKLVYFSDKEGKTREVAIFDYFSQTSLRPLHKYLFEALKKIPQDFTFDQTGFKRSLLNSEVFYSLDLTAFTDRFPIRVNKDLLEARIGPERAEAWFQIMTQSFSVKDSVLRYSVGNPMGAYSSWNSTTLSHHFVVWKACQNKGVNWKTLPYAMLGDDLVIGHRLVALEYCRLIRTLGVNWSKEKTHVSPHFYEFAKRLHWCGFDISPFPIAGLWSERNRLVGQIQVFDNAISKGWFSIPELLENCDEYFRFLSIPRRLRTEWCDKMSKAWIIISVLQKRSSALELLPFVEKISPQVASLLDETKIYNILVNSIMLTFVDSSENLLDHKKHKDTLGQIAVDISIFLTGIRNPDTDSLIDAISLPESLPHTHVWGLVSEDYLRAQREAYIIDTVRKGNWDPLLKNLKIPISDKSFYFFRNTDPLYIHSLEIVNKFEESIKQLALFPGLI